MSIEIQDATREQLARVVVQLTEQLADAEKRLESYRKLAEPAQRKLFQANVICQRIVFSCHTEEEAEDLYNAFHEADGNTECPLCRNGITLNDDDCEHLVEVEDEADHSWEVCSF